MADNSRLVSWPAGLSIPRRTIHSLVTTCPPAEALSKIPVSDANNRWSQARLRCIIVLVITILGKATMSGTSILTRCISLVSILAESSSGKALGELSRQTGLPKSATHRMLTSLVEAGFVEQIPASRDYRLTMKLIGIGFRFLEYSEIVIRSQPILDRLAEQTQELVRLCVVDSDHLVWLAKSQGVQRGMLIDPVMGREVPLHATATGKIWLASLGDDAAESLVLRDGFGTVETHGPKVLSSVDTLFSELATARKTGYALAIEEAEPGVSAIAVGIPSKAHSNAPLWGTISLAGPSFRLPPRRLKEMLPSLQASAIELSHAFTNHVATRTFLDQAIGEGTRAQQ